MRLLANWFGDSKIDATVDSKEQAIPDVECGMPDAPFPTLANKEFVSKTKIHFKELLANIHVITIRVYEDKPCRLIRKGGEAGWFSIRPVLFEKLIENDELLEYLKPLSDLKFNFEGPFEKTKALLMSIGDDWFRKQISVSITISDHLYTFAMNERYDFMRFILACSRNYRDHEVFNIVPAESRRHCIFRHWVSHSCQFEKIVYFDWLKVREIRVSGHDLLSFSQYDFFREDVLHKTLNEFTVPPNFEIVRKVVHREADSYTEENSRIEYEFEGRKMVATLIKPNLS